MAPQSHHSSTSPNTFLSFPLEARAQIYHVVLISPTSMVAHSTFCITSSYGRYYKASSQYKMPNPPTTFNVPAYLKNGRPVEELAIYLMLRHPTIAAEAAAIFSSQNAFRFHKEWIWDTVLQGLEKIGPQNRACLRVIEINMHPLQHIWRLTDEALTELLVCTQGSKCRAMRENERERVYPRNRHLQTRENGVTEGVVGNINPAMEKVFEPFGGMMDEGEITMRLLFERDTPGGA